MAVLGAVLVAPWLRAAAQEPTVPDSLTLTLVVPEQVRTGARVPITLRLENRGSRPLDLSLRGRTLTFDVEVSDSSGAVRWRRLEGEIIPAIVHLRTLAPGERLEVEAAWDRAAAPGPYRVRGLLLVEGPPRPTPPVPLRIVPR
jgi:hypothetical protein